MQSWQVQIDDMLLLLLLLLVMLLRLGESAGGSMAAGKPIGVSCVGLDADVKPVGYLYSEPGNISTNQRVVSDASESRMWDYSCLLVRWVELL